MSALGPVTERRFADAFARCAVITAKAAAELIGVDEKTLGALTDRGVLRAVPRGRLRAYTEHDLRAYLTEEHHIAPAPPAQTRPSARQSSRVVAFSQLNAGRPEPARRG